MGETGNSLGLNLFGEGRQTGKGGGGNSET